MGNRLSVDHSFLAQRRAGRYVGLYVLPVALTIVAACWVALFAWWPLAVNPWFAVGHFEGQIVEPGTATKYAMTAAVLMNLLMFAIATAIALGIGWARTERRYLRLLAAASESTSSPEPPAASQPASEFETRR